MMTMLASTVTIAVDDDDELAAEQAQRADSRTICGKDFGVGAPDQQRGVLEEVRARRWP